MTTIIVYQGLNGQFRSRVGDDEGGFVEHTELFADQADAITAAEELAARYDGACIELRESIAALAAREAAAS